METTPTVDTAIDCFDVRSDEGSTVRFYNAAEEELVGVRHAEDGMLHAVLNTSDGGAAYEKTVGGLPFAEGEADELL